MSVLALVGLLLGCGDSSSSSDAGGTGGGGASSGGEGGAPSGGAGGATGGGGSGASGGGGGTAGSGGIGAAGGSGGAGGEGPPTPMDWASSYSLGFTRSLALAPDYGFVLGGNLDGFSGDSYLAKVADDGTLVWQKDLSTENPEYLFEVKRVPAGGHVAIGYEEGASEAARLLRVDDSGQLLWEKRFASASVAAINWVTLADLDVDVLPNGGFAIGFGAGLLLTDADGDLTGQWSMDAGLVSDVIAMSNGDVVLLGEDFAIRVDDAGTLVWARTYSFPLLISGTEIASGDVVVVGRTNSDGGGMLVAELEGSSGDVAWSNRYPDEGGPGYQNYATSVRSLPGGELLLAGVHYENVEDHVWQVRLASDGMLLDRAIFVQYTNESLLLASLPVALPADNGGTIVSAPEDVALFRRAPNSPNETCPLMSNFKSFIGDGVSASLLADNLIVSVTPLVVAASDGDTILADSAMVANPIVCP